jgi:chitodextrinase
VVPAPASPPGAPQDLVAIVEGAGVALTWSAAPGAAAVEGYEVLRDDVPVSRVGGLRALDLGMPAARRYCYVVVAIDAAGGRSPPSAGACATPEDLTPPSAPAHLTVTLATPTSARLEWTPADDDVGVVRYELLRGGELVGLVVEPRARQEGLRPARTVCYAVVAHDAAGHRSEPSPTACLTPPDVTPPTPPEDLVAVAGPARVTLAWTRSRDDVGVAGYEVLQGGAVVAAVPDPGLPIGPLHAAREACFTVRALDAAGHRSAEAGPACATPPDVTAPSQPWVVARAEAETAVTFRWAPAMDDVGVVAYEVTRDGGAAQATREVAVTYRGLRPWTRVCATVVARDGAGNRSRPSEPVCLTTPDRSPPTAPPGLAVRALSESAVELSWGPSTDDVGVARYLVRRDGQVVSAVEAGSRRATFHGLKARQRACFSVTAMDGAGNTSGEGGPACLTMPDLTPPATPPALAAAPSSPTQVVLAWEPPPDEDLEGYEVRREPGFKTRVARPALAEPGLLPDTEYCYVVRAFDTAGNLSGPSARRCARTAKAGTPAGPWGLSARRAPSGDLVLDWIPSTQPGVVYSVYWDGRGKEEKRVGTTARNTFTVFGQVARERHCYRVVAEDEAQHLSPMTLPVCVGAPAAISAAP